MTNREYMCSLSNEELVQFILSCSRRWEIYKNAASQLDDFGDPDDRLEEWLGLDKE